ncbi:MAG: iron chelate uptake ABC transporter family permease subunit [Aliarcobacter sp.]
MKIVLYIFSFIIICLAPFLGEISLTFKDIFDSSSTTHTIFWDLRVSRVVLAFFVGGILALGGLIFQIILKMN